MPISKEQRNCILKLCRSVLLEKINPTKKSDIKNLLKKLENLRAGVFISLCEKNKTLACVGISEAGALSNNVLTVARATLTQIPERRIKKELHFEIDIIFKEKKISSHEQLNLGLDAFKIYNGTASIFKSSIPIKYGWGTRKLFEKLKKKAQIFDSNENCKMSSFKSISFREDASNIQKHRLFDLYRNNELILQKEVSVEKIKRVLSDGINYIHNATVKKDNFIYIYKPNTKKIIFPKKSHEYIRCYAAFWALLESNNKNVDSSIYKLILDRIAKNLQKNDKGNFLIHESIADLGTNALFLICDQIIYNYRQSKYNNIGNHALPTFFSEDGYLFTFIKDGIYHKGREQQYFLPFMAMIALLRQRKHIDFITKKAFPYYLNLYETNEHAKQPMSLWLCRLIDEIVAIENSQVLVNTIFNICDQLLPSQNYPTDENFDLFGSYTKDFTTCTTAVILETLSIGLRFSYQSDRERFKKYLRSTLLGLRFLFQMQYTFNNSFDVLSYGGFRHSPFNPEIRIDSVQHAVFALKNILSIMD